VHEPAMLSILRSIYWALAWSCTKYVEARPWKHMRRRGERHVCCNLEWCISLTIILTYTNNNHDQDTMTIVAGHYFANISL